MRTKPPTVAERTYAAYEALPEPQRLVFEVAFKRECALWHEYRRFGMRDYPLAKGARWRWMPHDDLRAGLKARGVTKGYGDAYRALAAAGLVEHHVSSGSSSVTGGGIGRSSSRNHTIRLTTPGRVLGRKLWPDTEGASSKGDYRGHATYRQMVSAHLAAPHGPEDLREWLLDTKGTRRGDVGIIQARGHLLRETGEYVTRTTTLELWLTHEFGHGTGLGVTHDSFTYVAGINRRRAVLPDWAVHFHLLLSDLLRGSTMASAMSGPSVPLALAMIALTMATAEGVLARAFFVPRDRLAMLDVGVTVDGQVHALYPNGNTAYTACEQYLDSGALHQRGRLRDIRAFLPLAALTQQWPWHLSTCPDCLRAIAHQASSGGLRSFLGVAQLEDARLAVEP